MSYPEGDIAGARSDVPRALPPGNAEQTSWPFIDVAAVLAGGMPEPPTPTVCRRDDGVGLFYPGQVNAVFGDPESGKTWLSYAAAVEALGDGGRVLVVDADHNGANQVLWRLTALGATPEVLADPAMFRLAEPEDRRDLLAVVHQAAEWKPTLAVVDSVGEVLPILGKSSNSPDDYTDAHRLVLRPLAMSGAAVVQVDHLPKSPDSRQAGPTGTAAKGRAVGGVSLRVTLREPFAPGRGGSAMLSIRKDRPGGLRAASPVVPGGESAAGVFSLTAVGDRLRWDIAKPSDGDGVSVAEMSGRVTYEPTEDDFAALDRLADGQRATVRAVKTATRWGSDKATVVLRAWRAERGQERSGNAGTGVNLDVPRSSDPTPEEDSNAARPCAICDQPLNLAALATSADTCTGCESAALVRDRLGAEVVDVGRRRA